MIPPLPCCIPPEKWLDAFERALWACVTRWRLEKPTYQVCAANFEQVLLEFKRPPAPLRLLTTRQAEVLVLWIKGKGKREIGSQMSISPKTVEVHYHEAKRRLGLKTFREVMLFGAKHKLVEFE